MSVRSLDLIRRREWMHPEREKTRVTHLVSMADIAIDGGRPRDIRVDDDRLYRRVAAEGSAGLGDGYMDAWWDCDAPDEMM